MPVPLIRIDTRPVEKMLSDVARRQLPFAMSTSLNLTAKLASTEANSRFDAIFARVTAFTKRSVFAPPEQRATKDKLSAVVAIRPIQAKYLGLEILGGIRTPANNTRVQSTAFVVPGKGNTPLRPGAVKRIAAQAAADRSRRAAVMAGQRRATALAATTGVFLMSGRGPLGGPGGFFRRTPGHHLTRLIAFESVAHYRPKYRFRTQVLGTVMGNFDRIFSEQMAKALATAK